MRLFVPNNTALTLLLIFTAVAISSCNDSEDNYDACRKQAINGISDEDKLFLSTKENATLREGSIDDIFEEFQLKDLSSESSDDEEEEEDSQLRRTLTSDQRQEALPITTPIEIATPIPITTPIEIATPIPITTPV